MSHDLGTNYITLYIIQYSTVCRWAWLPINMMPRSIDRPTNGHGSSEFKGGDAEGAGPPSEAAWGSPRLHAGRSCVDACSPSHRHAWAMAWHAWRLQATGYRLYMQGHDRAWQRLWQLAIGQVPWGRVLDRLFILTLLKKQSSEHQYM